jgi:hypothetical protein
MHHIFFFANKYRFKYFMQFFFLYLQFQKQQVVVLLNPKKHDRKLQLGQLEAFGVETNTIVCQ